MNADFSRAVFIPRNTIRTYCTSEGRKQREARRKREYYLKHKDEWKERNNTYYLQHKDTKLKEYTDRSKEKIAQYKAQYYAHNKSAFAARRKKYYDLNKEKVVANAIQYYQDNRLKIEERLAETKLKLEAELRQNRDELRKKLEENLAINKPTDWYSVTVRPLYSHPLTKRYIRFFSFASFLRVLYPDEPWIEGNFSRVAPKTWQDQEKVADYLKSLEDELLISKKEDWYRISLRQMCDVGAGGLLAVFGSLHKLLSYTYPEVNWDLNLFSYRGKKAKQRWLFECAKKLYPDTDICENFSHPGLFWEGNRKMELDIWIPKHSIAFEYQGEQHYHKNLEAPFDEGLPSFEARDEAKRRQCFESGITIFYVPYWWDSDLSSLTAIINNE